MVKKLKDTNIYVKSDMLELTLDQAHYKNSVENILIGRKSKTKFLTQYNQHCIPIFKFENLKNTGKVNIYLKDGDDLDNFDLPDWLKEKFGEYLRNRINIEKCKKYLVSSEFFDCQSFVSFLKGFESVSSLLNLKTEEIEYTDDKTDVKGLVSGDIVYLSEQGKINNPRYYGYFHFMIYLGKGYYLSKQGDYGVIIEKRIHTSNEGLKLYKVIEENKS